MVVANNEIDATKNADKLTTINDHADAAVRHVARRPMKHILGFT